MNHRPTLRTLAVAAAVAVAAPVLVPTASALEQSWSSCKRLYDSCMRNTDLLKDDPEAYRKGMRYCLELYDDCLTDVPAPTEADPGKPTRRIPGGVLSHG